MYENGRYVWSHHIAVENQGYRTVNSVPVIFKINQENYIASSSCITQVPHTCNISVFNQNGDLLWSKTTMEGLITQAISQKNYSLNPPPLIGRIQQIMFSPNDDILLIPLCPSYRVPDTCQIIALHSKNGTIKWKQVLPGISKGDILVSEKNVIFVNMCDLMSISPKVHCKNIYAAYKAEDGELLWFQNLENLTVNSHFHGLILNDLYITIATDLDNSKTYALGIDLKTGHLSFQTFLPGLLCPKVFIASAIPSNLIEERQFFIMCKNNLISLDGLGNILWTNSNSSDYVKSMVVDPNGSIYVSTRSLHGKKNYVGSLDVYNARDGSFSFNILIDECYSNDKYSVPIIPYFVIMKNKSAYIMCQAQLLEIYSSTIPFWVSIIIGVSILSSLILIIIFAYFYHWKRNINKGLYYTIN